MRNRQNKSSTVDKSVLDIVRDISILALTITFSTAAVIREHKAKPYPTKKG